MPLLVKARTLPDGLREHWTSARRHWGLQCDGLYRLTANSRDRHSHGNGSPAETCFALRINQWFPPGRGWHPYWPRRQLGVYALPVQPNIRCFAHGPMDLHRGGNAYCACRTGGLLHPCPSRHPHEFHDCPTIPTDSVARFFPIPPSVLTVQPSFFPLSLYFIFGIVPCMIFRRS